METSHLWFTTPIGPPISLQAPNARQGAARFSASYYAYHGIQLLYLTNAAELRFQLRGWEPSHYCYRATRSRAVGPPTRHIGLYIGEDSESDAGDISNAEKSSSFGGR